MMAAYKILLVEDELAQRNDAIKSLFANYFCIKDQIGSTQGGQRFDQKETFGSPGLDGYALPAQKSGKTGIKLENELSKIPFLDIATNIVDALKKVSANAENYVLFIVDRDLGTVGKETKVEIEKIWKDFNSEKEVTYAGDLLLEYLCLEKGMVNECKERFRFLTGNDEQIKDLQDFLEAMHFPKNLIGKKAAEGGGATAGEMIIGKAATNQLPYETLLKKVNNPLLFHLMAKHRDVFNTLRENADDLCVYESDHVKNLVKALAYVEDVWLEGQGKPEPPSIGLLRQLLEAFRRTMKERLKNENDSLSIEEKTLNKYFNASFSQLKEVNENNDPQKNELAHWFNPSGYLGYHPKGSSKECRACKKIHKNPQRQLRNSVYFFQQENEHYAYIDRLIFAITSQEIHHNNRPRFEHYRLQLVVYGICELLVFYQDKIKTEPIVPEKKDLWRDRILDLLPFLDKDEDGWVKCEALPFFSQYLDGLNDVDLESIGVEVREHENEKKFRMIVE